MQVTILYGSQTGNAEHISKHLQQEIEAIGVTSVVVPLEKYELVDWSGLNVFVVSSTGDGDSPDHSLPFYRWLRKLKKMEKHELQGQKYCLLGLGDTNYTNFNGNALKTIKILKEMKMETIFRNDLADDAVGIESVVDPWIDDILTFISNRFKIKAVEPTESIEITNQLECITISTIQPLFSVQSVAPIIKPSRLPAHVKWDIKDGNFPFSTIFEFHAKVKSFDDFHKNATTSTLISGKCLTLPSSIKTTLLITIKVDKYEYKAGDSIGMVFGNEEHLVMDLMTRFGYPNSNPIISHTEYKDITLYDLLKYKIEFKFPSKRFIRLIAEYCSLDQDKTALLFLTSKEGSHEFNRLRSLKLNIVDILNGFPSCSPPIYALSLLDILKPRYYSIVSYDPLDSIATIVFTIENYKCVQLNRVGLATGQIDQLLSNPRQLNHMATVNCPLLTFPFPTASFHLELDCPLVFIGPGSGIAPYIQFLKSKNLNQQAVLIQGCRGSEDWILNQELTTLSKSATTDYYVAYSRSKACSIQHLNENRVYSSDLIDKIGTHLGYEKVGAYVWDVLYTFRKQIMTLFDDDAVFYLCGDASQMVKMFIETMKLILKNENNISMEMASKIVQTMIENKKIRMDVWG